MLAMNRDKILNFCASKITKDKFLQKYILSYGLSMSEQDILKDISTHNKYLDLSKDLGKYYNECEDTFPLVECNLGHIDKKRLSLIRNNIDAFSTDLDKFFIHDGVIKIHDGTKYTREILFSTRENRLILFVKSLDLNLFSGICIDVIDNKPDIGCCMSAQEYLERIKTTVIPIPLNKMAEQRCLDALALLFYINQLATTRREVKVGTRTLSGIPTKKSSAAATNNKGSVSLPRVVYILNEKGFVTRRGDWTRQTDAWSVSGHWRTYKSGKKVWIDGYTKGEGNATRKVYKV